MCVCGFLYPLRLLLYLFTHVPLALVYAVRGREKKRGKKKKSSPCTHSSVLISILSSPLLPPPLVTTGVCCWHFWQPGDKKTHTSRCSVIPLVGKRWVSVIIIFFYLLSPRHRQSAASFDRKTFLRLPSGEHTNADSNTATNSSGLFRSAPDNQIAAT